MGLLENKGYGFRQTVFVFDNAGEKATYTSNCVDWKTALGLTDLPQDSGLISASTTKMPVGLSEEEYVDEKWIIEGITPSIQTLVPIWINLGFITKEEGADLIKAGVNQIER